MAAATENPQLLDAEQILSDQSFSVNNKNNYT
ncbi:uncharacterized protein METZ01_LOCUS138682 [marine metagenome]|uniref:Uncharacterized protein n=1 Tax=marine metagenome TaxID=408172 RepID=A0A381Z996_9ZZZZ